MENKIYPEVKQLNLPEIDKQILQFWTEHNTFEQSIETRADAEPFVFFEGPPSANGMPGIHHVMSRTLKDLFCRYQTLKGKKVERKGGWDTHGLPIELAVEKRLGIKKDDIGVSITIADYNAECRKEVLKFKEAWDDLTRKMGYWVDLENPYITYENSYIESLWWILKQFYNKGLLYKGYTIQPYSPAAGTGLSSHELNLPGCYKNVKDTSATVMFRISDPSLTLPKGEDLVEVEDEVFFLAWTTTPWTLPSNCALAVGANIEYVSVRTFNPYTYLPITVILAKEAYVKYFILIYLENYSNQVILDWLQYGRNETTPKLISSFLNEEITISNIKTKRTLPNKIISTFKGSDLAGIRYEQLFKYVQPESGDNFKVIVGDFVSTEDGTGIVHIAPSFGADDMRVGKQNNIGALTLVNKQGKFVDEVTDFAGQYVKGEYYTEEEKEALTKEKGWKNFLSIDEQISIKLKTENRAFKVERYEHNYPHCWRTDKPILYYPLDSWFIKTTAVKDRMVELNKTINWKPESTGTGRFGNWLENLVDWNLSRSRYWGTPLPIWRTEDGTEEICIGSVEELNKEIEKSVQAGYMKAMPSEETVDLHKPFVDEIILVSPLGKKMVREADLIDVWFDSGAMPYAQWHYPFNPSLTLPKGERTGKPGYVTADPTTYKLLRERQLELRNNSTEAENLLWKHLKAHGADEHFRRQHIVGNYIPDFVCLKKNLVVEVNGGIHRKKDVAERDEERTKALNEMGFKVIRFTNEEIFNDVEAVVSKIKAELKVLPFGEDLGGVTIPFPADFISEGVDQTRGWFFTLHAIGTMLMDSVAFKNVVSNGLVLDKNGNKMSKRLGNTVEPFETIAKYGADATRWYMITNAQPWDNLKFDINGIGEVQRKFFGTLFNTYSFFSLYANIDGFQLKEENIIPVNNRPEIDRWIISKLNTLIKEVDSCYVDYEPTKAGRAIQDFVDAHLSNWYVRLCRRRFWKGELNDDKKAAYETLFECLITISQLMSPVAPFFADWLYQNLTNNLREKNANTKYQFNSVHLSHFNNADESLIDESLNYSMQLAQEASSLILSLRKKGNIKVRQPLSKVLIPSQGESFEKHLKHIAELIKSEVNIKELDIVRDLDFAKKKIKPNFRNLGKIFGKEVPNVVAILNTLSQGELNVAEKTKTISISLNEKEQLLSLEEFEIITEDIPGWEVASSDLLTVALDISISEELKNEGNAREIVNRIQNLRKEKDFDVTDRIKITVEQNENMNDTLNAYKNYICSEVLATELVISANLQNADEVEVNENAIKLIIERNLN